MKKVILSLMLVMALFVGTVSLVPAQQNKNLTTGRVIFLCGATSQQVMDQMMPVIPKITKDNYNFIYLTYDVNGTLIIFSFFNDRLQGLLIGR